MISRHSLHQFRRASLIALSMLVACESLAQWVQTNGPYGGDVYALAQSPTGKIYAATFCRGVYASVDNGTTWALVGNPLVGIYFCSLAIDSYGRVYVGSDLGSVLRSSDEGMSWSTVFGSYAGNVIQSIMINSSGHIFVVTRDQGVARSTDDGISWTTVFSGTMGYQRLAIDQNGTIFLGYGSVYRSTDNGDNWSQVLSSSGCAAVAVGSGGLVVASETYDIVHRSTDGGDSWSESALPNSGTYMWSLGIDPAGRIFAGTMAQGTYRSDDGGVSWTLLNDPFAWSAAYSFLFPASNTVLVAGEAAGVQSSSDNGSTWTDVSDGINARYIATILVEPSGTLFAAGFGVFRSTDYGQLWTEAGNLRHAVSDLARNPAGAIYAGSRRGVYRSSDGGQSWVQRNTGLTDTSVASVAVTPGGTVLIGNSLGVERSTNEGASWANVASMQRPEDLLVTTSGSVLATTRGVFRSNDDGVSWMQTCFTNGNINTLVQSSSGEIFAGSWDMGIYKSIDDGMSWTQVTQLVPYRGFLQDLGSDSQGHLYACLAFGAGVCKSTDAGITWTPYLAGLPSVHIYAPNFTPNGDMFVGTEGSGVFRRPLASAPQLVGPSEGETIAGEEITFTWSDVGAIRYELYVDNAPGLGSAEISKRHISALENLTQPNFTISGNWLSANVYYWKVVAFYPEGDSATSETGNFTYAPPKTAAPLWVPVYRAYLGTDVDHFYCTSESHLATAVNQGYVFEKADGYLAQKPFQTAAPADVAPVFRFYATADKSHFYTTSEFVRDSVLIANPNWIYEGITGYCYSNPQPGLTGLYSLYLENPSPALRDHFYTISAIERENALSRGYQDRGLMGYTSANGDSATASWMSGQLIAGDGVNTQNGGFNYYTRTSFSIPGRRLSLDFAHSYNSYSVGLFNLINPLGPGWSHSYQAFLVERADREYAFVVWPGGSVHEYERHGEAYRCTTPGVYDSLEVIGQDQYAIRKKDQTVFAFSRPPGVTAEYPALLTSITDRNGNSITCSYETSGLRRLTTVTHEGRSLAFEYHPAPKSRLLWKVTDPLGRFIEFNYDDVDTNLTSFKSAQGGITGYEYYPNARHAHLLLRVRLPEGNYLTNTYGGKKVTSQVGAVSLNFAYAPNQTTITDPLGRRFDHFYTNNAKASLLSQILFSGGSVSYTRGDADNPTLPTLVVDGNGNATQTTYDSRGNPLTITQPGAVLHQFQYNSTNDLTRYVNPRGQESAYTYDSNGNLVSVQDPRGTTSLGYSPGGLINTIADPLAQAMTLGYNSFGNVTSVRDNLGNTTQYAYDGASRVTSSTNPKSQSSAYTYNADDRIISSQNALGQFTTYAFDLNGNLRQITNAASQGYSFSYDALDRLASKSNPGLPSRTYTYDLSGRLASRTDPNSRVTSYSYDGVGRISSISSPTKVATLAYDNNHNLTAVTEGANSLLFAYDALNRLRTTNDFFGNSVAYGYDEASNITSIGYPGSGAGTVEYTHTSDDRISTVRTWTDQIFTYHYRNDGTIDFIDYPNGCRASYSYDGASRLIGITHAKAGGQVICSYLFSLDQIGNHVAVTQTEPFGAPSLIAGTMNYSYDGGNRILSGGGSNFIFDNCGNLVSRTGTTSETFTYDTENRLTNIAGGTTATYLYDVFGNRRSATRNGVTTRYVLDVNGPMSRVMAEQDADGQPLAYYIYGHTLLARIKPDGTMHCYHGDFRGSTIAMTDAGGNITHKYSYGPFGEILASEEQDHNPFRYVGSHGVMDEGNGLYFMRARYYSPSFGRFTSEDPRWIDNLYLYVQNGPITSIDPDGQVALEVIRAGFRSIAEITRGARFMRSGSNIVAVRGAGSGGGYAVRSVANLSAAGASILRDLLINFAVGQYAEVVEGGRGEDAPSFLSWIPILGSILGHVKTAGEPAMSIDYTIRPIINQDSRMMSIDR